jgi:hypothetical protein
MMKKEPKIYLLIDPRSPDQIKYVGFTRYPLPYRLKGHLMDSSDTYKARWIRTLLRHGVTPIIKLYKIVTWDTWAAEEILAISTFRDSGHKLVNTSNGGDGGGTRSAETKRKISVNSKKMWSNPEYLQDHLRRRVSKYEERHNSGYFETKREEFKARQKALRDSDPLGQVKRNARNLEFLTKNPTKQAEYNATRNEVRRVTRLLAKAALSGA